MKARPASHRTSVAVMARRAEPADSLDYFPTPPWATRALCEHVLPMAWPWPDIFNCSAWDPACGEGHMALALDDYFAGTFASDIHGYGYAPHVSDFLHPEPAYMPEADWIISNPPFNRAAEFIQVATRRARRGVAMLVRTQFVEGQERYRNLFRDMPPQIDAIFAERVPMHRGRWVVNGSTATAYTWLVWLPRPRGGEWRWPRRMWIPPGQRKALTKPDDWLRFRGCEDLPKDHPAMLELARIQKEAAEEARKNAGASIDDVRAQLERLI